MKTWEKKKPEKKRKESPEDVEDETSSTILIPPTTPIPPTTTIPPTTPTRTIRPCTPITTRPSTSAASTDSPMASGISKNLLDQLRSRPVVLSPGTPAEAHPDSDEDDMLVNRNIDLVKEGNVRKAHCGGITTVNMFDVEVCDSNGKDLPNKLLFNSKLNKKVNDELVGPGKVSIVRLNVTAILEKTIVGVMAFTRLDDGPDHVGDAQFLGDTFYRVLKPRGA